MGATENRRDSADPEFTGFEAIFCTILLYVFAAILGGKRAFFEVDWYKLPIQTTIVPVDHGHDRSTQTHRRQHQLHGSNTPDS